MILYATSAGTAEAAVGCKGKPISTGQLKTTDQTGILLGRDGQKYRIAGLVFFFHPTSMSPQEVKADRAANRMIDAFLRKPSLTVLKMGDKPDRYNRMPVRLHSNNSISQIWLPELLVANGLALVRPGSGKPACTASLIAAEKEARSSNLGI